MFGKLFGSHDRGWNKENLAFCSWCFLWFTKKPWKRCISGFISPFSHQQMEIGIVFILWSVRWSLGVKSLGNKIILRSQKTNIGVFDNCFSAQVFQHRRLTTIVKLSLHSQRMFASHACIITNINGIIWKGTKTGNWRASKILKYISILSNCVPLEEHPGRYVFCHQTWSGLKAMWSQFHHAFFCLEVTALWVQKQYLHLDKPSCGWIAHLQVASFYFSTF